MYQDVYYSQTTSQSSNTGWYVLIGFLVLAVIVGSIVLFWWLFTREENQETEQAFTVNMNYHQISPVYPTTTTASNGTGIGSMQLTKSENQVNYAIKASGLQAVPTSASIFNGKIGVTGSKLTDLTIGSTGGTAAGNYSCNITGSWTKTQKTLALTDEDIKLLKTGETYITLYTNNSTYTNGEIRGQIIPNALPLQ